MPWPGSLVKLQQLHVRMYNGEREVYGSGTRVMSFGDCDATQVLEL
jgi:hypothetical protein